uniref:Uncharacterized protein n=1 Tax=Romanomermis culicivorax TaxID=13658 RepID=A0A915L0S4_ROMCU
MCVGYPDIRTDILEKGYPHAGPDLIQAGLEENGQATKIANLCKLGERRQGFRMSAIKWKPKIDHSKEKKKRGELGQWLKSLSD